MVSFDDGAFDTSANHDMVLAIASVHQDLLIDCAAAAMMIAHSLFQPPGKTEGDACSLADVVSLAFTDEA